MAYSNFRNGFNVQTAVAIDKRILLTKAQMLTAEDDFMLPDVYFCLCADDGKFYIYNVNNDASAETGKYRVIDESITFTSEAAKTQLNNAIANSVKIGEINQEITDIKGDVTTLQTDVSTLQTEVEDPDTGLAKKVADLKAQVESFSLNDIPGTVDGGEVSEE